MPIANTANIRWRKIIGLASENRTKLIEEFYCWRNTKTTRRWFWYFLVARGGIDQGRGCSIRVLLFYNVSIDWYFYSVQSHENRLFQFDQYIC